MPLQRQIELKQENATIINSNGDYELNLREPVYINEGDTIEIKNMFIDTRKTSAEGTINILEFAKRERIPTVIATTGFSDAELKKIENYSKDIPIFRSASMSYKIYLVAKLAADLAQKLADSDIEIVETHHNRKVDAPSGIALILANSINEALNNEMIYEYDRHGKRQKREKKEIGIHSLRGGNEVGKHSVIFFGNDESLEITHNVTSRTVFANGAIKAALFISSKEPGLYNMNNLF